MINKKKAHIKTEFANCFTSDDNIRRESTKGQDSLNVNKQNEKSTHIH